MKNKFLALLFLLLFFSGKSFATYVLVPMDETQKDHLKSYGAAFWVLQNQLEVDWLLNYRGGSFAFRHDPKIENELVVRNISYVVISDAQYSSVLSQISDPDANMDVMKLEKVPKIAVYSPKTKQPWDDAVTMVLTYAEIPYDVVFDEEVLKGDLPKYDWLHLHHEDFTGQYGKFYINYRNQPWYIAQVQEAEQTAKKFGYGKVSQLKLAVVKKMTGFTAGGGFLFAMCSAADAYDSALAGECVDMIGSMYDGGGSDPNADRSLDYCNAFAFKNFHL